MNIICSKLLFYVTETDIVANISEHIVSGGK